MSWSSGLAQRDSLDTHLIVSALKTVPKFKITLLELAQRVVTKGKVDMKKASFYREELDEAISEAIAYGKSTREAVQCLRTLVRRRSP
ncbi:MAG: hypothetical protein HYX84_02570 [Chloroflexi bacterium]|nr:hypothetical protein [Chloroflexota bacterium]